MADDKPTLTRRRVLGGAATIGLAGALGTGTYALFNDDETFTGNSLTAGELDLVVDWATDVDQGSFGSSASSGQVNGDDNTYSYQISDVKPGDSGTLAFCPKIIDNEGYLWIGTRTGVTDNDNGLTEPEEEAGDTTGGAGEGELSQFMEFTAYLAHNVRVDSGEVKYDSPHKIIGPVSLSTLAATIAQGFLIEPEDSDGTDTDPYPASDNSDDQQGPCLVLEWNVPRTVGNVIQSDSVEMDFSFEAIQSRHNPTPNNPFDGS